LARLQLGRDLNTNFISGTNRGLTEEERKELLIQLRSAAIDFAKNNFPPSSYSLIPDIHAGRHKRSDFWPEILRNNQVKKFHR
jgi:hypothetical protein